MLCSLVRSWGPRGCLAVHWCTGQGPLLFSLSCCRLPSSLGPEWQQGQWGESFLGENYCFIERNLTLLPGYTRTLVCTCVVCLVKGVISVVSEAPHLGWVGGAAVGIGGLEVTGPGATFVDSGAADPSGKGAM